MHITSVNLSSVHHFVFPVKACKIFGCSDQNVTLLTSIKKKKKRFKNQIKSINSNKKKWIRCRIWEIIWVPGSAVSVFILWSLCPKASTVLVLNTCSLLVPSYLHLWQKTGKIHTQNVSVTPNSKCFNLQTVLSLCCHIKMQFTVSHFVFLWTEWVSLTPGMTENVLIWQTIQNDELHCTDYFWQVRLQRSASSHAVTVIMSLHSPVSEIVTITDWFLNTSPNGPSIPSVTSGWLTGPCKNVVLFKPWRHWKFVLILVVEELVSCWQPVSSRVLYDYGILAAHVKFKVVKFKR